MDERDRTDDLADGDDLPQPGTEEPPPGAEHDRGDPTAGPGNVSVDEPTGAALEDDSEG